MSVTISFSLRDGVVLPRDVGECLARRALVLVDEFARVHGWTGLGTVDTRGVPRRDAWGPPPFCGRSWRVSGGARFTIALIDGTGQLAETSVRTSDADHPRLAHRSVLSVLARLNAEVYGGQIDSIDETGYAESGDEGALLAAFAANEHLVGNIVHVLVAEGWTVKDRAATQTNGRALIPSGEISSSDDVVLQAEIIDDDATEERQRGAWPPTLLEQFLKMYGIKPEYLARESGYSRQFLLNLRMGRMLPSRACAAQIVAALRRLGRMRVDTTHVFERVLPTARRLLQQS